MLSGVILSGGLGTRMGAEKGLAQLGNAPLISYVAKTQGELVDEIVVAVAKNKSRRYSEVLGERFVFVEDSRSGMGPLEGLVEAFEAAKGQYVLVSPCDTPFLRSSVCKTVVSHAKGRDGAVPWIDKKFEPLHGVYRRDVCLRAFRNALDRGKRKPIQAYEGLDIALVDESELRGLDPELESFWNLNTFEELQMAEESLQKRRP